MKEQLAKMSLAELKARAYDLIGIYQTAGEQLNMVNNEIARRQAQTPEKKEEQLELPLDKKFETEPEA